MKATFLSHHNFWIPSSIHKSPVRNIPAWKQENIQNFDSFLSLNDTNQNQPFVQYIFGNYPLFFQFPNSFDLLHPNDTSNQPSGLVLVFHGCNRHGKDWFLFPEELDIIRHSLKANLAVLSFTSLQAVSLPQRSSCWLYSWPPEENRDLVNVIHVLDEFKKNHSISSDIPLYAVGVSSGGTFLTILMHKIRFRAVSIQISAGLPAAIESPAPIPIAFVSMPLDSSTSERVTATVHHLENNGIQCLDIKVSQKPLNIENILEGNIFEPEEAHLVYQIIKNYHLSSDLTLTTPVEEILKRLQSGFIKYPFLESLMNDRDRRDCFKEILSVAYGYHEVTREHFQGEILNFFFRQ